MDPIFKFSDNIVKTRYDDIPQEAVLATKRQLMDAIAAGIAGSSAESVKELFDIFTDWGGSRKALYGSSATGCRVLPPLKSMPQWYIQGILTTHMTELFFIPVPSPSHQRLHWVKVLEMSAVRRL